VADHVAPAEPKVVEEPGDDFGVGRKRVREVGGTVAEAKPKQVNEPMSTAR
jgi:hypothetical protein